MSGDFDSSYGFPSENQANGMTADACQNMIDRSLKTPLVKFLKDQLEKSGCGIGRNFISVRDCDENVAGGYLKGEGIVICNNEVTSQDEVTQALIHELIHVYDECRAANLDWTDCAHQACSEIRANHLSGDCHFKREFFRSYLKIKGQEQECVKRRAMKSLNSNPHCTETAAKDSLEAVWDICYNDTKPFDHAP